MVQEEIISAVRRYVSLLEAHGIPVRRAVLFGSCVRGEQSPDSDIDLLVVSPVFDQPSHLRRPLEAEIWRLTWRADPRLQPIPTGEKQFATDEVLPILEIARREGVEIVPPGPS